MKDNNETWRERGENEILFSRVVKAGKRVYYIDVKRDRRDEFYVSMTESKRVKEGTETERPVFEKHKIFLYREDLIKFLTALTDAAQFVGDHRPLTGHNVPIDDYAEHTPLDLPQEATLNTGFDIDF
ncbi:DUF3276 family protein [Alloprevotella sp. OH1205_COT-284]|uniref:DUF3276 family protein n=1 Tax=Alloprevotella sp. OH1205_COT-284 TaxID=2491043 RepID=UPI000F5E229C|nr:DUF3276 family protein [Alloprevotella sp. OH1205_COT-284]RRD80097.1 DUF3276 family protein [Alloprevotella sp. OH1205_COT-284]